MTKSYCVKQKKQTGCIEPSGYKTTQNGRLMHFCTCVECGIENTRFISKKDLYGGALDIQSHLSKLGEIHMRTPTMKKYNYCGPGTKLEERLTSNDPKIRDPINNLDAICQKHDIAYSEARSLKDKHKADDVMLDEISKIPYMKRPWGTTVIQAMITGKRKLGLGVKERETKKNLKGLRVKKTGKKN